MNEPNPVSIPLLFWNRLTKSQILSEAETLGEEWIATHKKLKKGELASAAAKAFAQRPDWKPDGI